MKTNTVSTKAASSSATLDTGRLLRSLVGQSERGWVDTHSAHTCRGGHVIASTPPTTYNGANASERAVMPNAVSYARTLTDTGVVYSITAKNSNKRGTEGGWPISTTHEQTHCKIEEHDPIGSPEGGYKDDHKSIRHWKRSNTSAQQVRGRERENCKGS